MNNPDDTPPDHEPADDGYAEPEIAGESLEYSEQPASGEISSEAEPSSPTEPGLGDAARAIAAIIALTLAIGIALGITMALVRGRGNGQMPPPNWILLPAMILNAGISLWAAWYFGCRKHAKSLSEGLAIQPVRRRQIVAAAFFGVLLVLLQLFAMSRFSAARVMQLSEAPISQAMGSAVLLMFAIAVTVPFGEELVYRGFFFTAIRNRLGALAAIVGSTFLFALGHVWQVGADLVVVMMIAMIGVFFAVQRHLTGSVVPSTITHVVYNAILVGMTAISVMMGPGAAPPGPLRARSPTASEIKSDLIGRMVGTPGSLGWTFDSLDEFKSFEIIDTDHKPGQTTYRIEVDLEGTSPPPAEATLIVTYQQDDEGWRLTSVSSDGPVRAIETTTDDQRTPPE